MMLQIWVYILLLFIPIIPQMQESLCFCCISAAECRLPHTVFFTVKTIVKWTKIVYNKDIINKYGEVCHIFRRF